jgi:hypothetical protein
MVASSDVYVWARVRLLEEYKIASYEGCGRKSDDAVLALNLNLVWGLKKTNRHLVKNRLEICLDEPSASRLYSWLMQ